MKSHFLIRVLFLAVVSAAAAIVSRAADGSLPFVSPIFGDNMVLQRGKPNTFWGWTKPGEEVRVSVAGKSASGTAGPDGRWQVKIDPPPVGTGCTVTIDGSQHAEFRNVIAGDVWLCGGQSNMAFGLLGAHGGREEAAVADHPHIRFFNVATKSSYGSVATPGGTWKVCTPENASAGWGGISAVGYYFAKKVEHETGVPIGLVVDCLGGSPAESWMAPDTLKSMEDFRKPMAVIEHLHEIGAHEYGSFLMNWLDEYDPGAAGDTWGATSLDDAGWKHVKLSTVFSDFGLEDVPCVVWLRREIDLPDPLPHGDITLFLGVIEKMDTAYLNGQWAGASSWVENPRRYRIRDGILHAGRNSIAIRVFKLKSKQGFMTGTDKLHVTLGDGTEIPIEGDWKAEVSVDARPPHPLPLGYENYPTMPSVLYRGMLAPVAPLAIKGALWYQGEANSQRAFQYRTLLPAMIADWRRLFTQGDFPFYIAGLPAFMQRHEPRSDDWSELREAQQMTAENVPNTGIAITIDTGEADNIHPREKKPVGDRLALLALKNDYGRDVVAQGPTYRSMKIEGPAVRVWFDHTDGGLKVAGDMLGEFALAGADRVWHPADAKIDGDTVVVSSADVKEPVAVRYAWQSNPVATLANGAGLPAAPFRSDDWPGVTAGRPPY